ncbi:MAG: cation diffusion facilitator family transporter [Bacteroidota bacterium]
MDHHQHQRENSALRLTGAIILNFAITAAEIIGGIAAGSLSLLSDALHNFSDGIALMISGIALRIGNQPKTTRYTFGKKRAEILAAALNASVLVVLCAFLVKEAYERFLHPAVPSGTIMFVVGGIGFFANLAGMLLLRGHTHHNLNFRSASLHFLSDTISSAGVICGGLAIRFWSVSWIDPLITILIALYIIWESYDIIKDTTDIFMMAAPSSISLEEVCSFMRTIPGIENVHHAHLWQMSETVIHFEAHIRVKDMTVSRTEGILSSLEHELQQRFNIAHITIQCECGRCDSQSLIV